MTPSELKAFIQTAAPYGTTQYCLMGRAEISASAIKENALWLIGITPDIDADPHRQYGYANFYSPARALQAIEDFAQTWGSQRPPEGTFSIQAIIDRFYQNLEAIKEAR